MGLTQEEAYSDGRAAVINEVGVWIEKELERLASEKALIPRGTKDSELTHKRATLAGNVIALCKVRALLNKKVVRMALSPK